MRVQLTDRFCQSAKSTEEAQTDYFDATVTGLALRVTSRGTKAWTLLYGSPRRRITLGRYPSLSLAAARAKAIETKEGRGQLGRLPKSICVTSAARDQPQRLNAGFGGTFCL